MGKKTYKRRVTATSKMAEKSPAAAELSSTQNIKKPRLKKSIQKRQIKSHLSQQRPVNHTSQQKKGRGKNQDSKSHKRKIAYSPEKRLKTYYSSLTGHQGKLRTDSKVNCIPSKTAKKQVESNSPGMNVEDRNPCGRVSKTENPQLPLTKRSRVSSPRQKQRSKLTAVEKRRYQAVSEYQFIYPGKAMFYCTKESMNQQLRSIYLGPRGQKSLKPTHQHAQMSCSQWDKNKTQWENSKTNASCPAGSKFSKSKHPNTIPHTLTSLMHKIDKLVLVSDIEMVPPSTPTGFPHNPQLQHQPPPLTSSLPAAILQRPNSSNERKASPEGGHMERESSSDVSLQRAPRNLLKVSRASSTKPRPLSAKDCCGKALNKKSGRDHQNRDSSKKEDVAESALGVSRSSRGRVAHSQSTSAMPAFRRFSSKENVTVKVLPQCLPKLHAIPS